MTNVIKQFRKFGMVEKLDQIYANSKNGDNAKNCMMTLYHRTIF